jgi:acetylornithine deacetylase/succinyl-diaminopimelate desuccinylase-like protein
MQSVEALHLLKVLGYKPKNTIRAVFFINEENGDRGGNKYAELAAQNKEEHIAAIESDLGGFTPRGFTFDGVSPALIRNINNNWGPLLAPYGSNTLVAGGGGTDIDPLKEQSENVVLIGYLPDSQRYFDVHHTPNDVFENVNKRELELGAASMASLIYLIDLHGFN